MRIKSLFQQSWIAIIMMMIGHLAAATTEVDYGDGLQLRLEHEPYRLAITDADGKELLVTRGNVSLARAQETFITQEDGLWWGWLDSFDGGWSNASRVVDAAVNGATLEATLAPATGPATVRLRVVEVGPGQLEIAYTAIDATRNRMRLGFVDREGDRYFGMGMRFNAVEHTGTRVRNWCEEKAVYDGTRPDTTYYPIPFVLNPKGYGLLLETSRFALFDFNAPRDPLEISPPAAWPDDAFRITHNDGECRFVFIHGPEPKRILEHLTARTGRIPRLPAPWTLGTWMAGNDDPDRQFTADAQTGSERCREIMEVVRRERIPASAIWTEDWWWGTMFTDLWAIDREAYPDFEDLNDEMHDRGFKHLGYFLPYFDIRNDVFTEIDANDWFVKRPDGSTYTWNMSSGIASFTVSQIDLTIPAAREFWIERYFAPAFEEMGFDGWMQDYSEYTPPDAVFANGETGRSMHNRYPNQWIEVAADYLAEADPSGDHVLFPRAGGIGTTAFGGVTVTGDHNANYEQGDGLPTSITVMLGLGLSGGAPLGGTDIAAYYGLAGEGGLSATDKDLYRRFVELGALQPIMRLHNGAVPFRHWTFDDDAETLAHFKRYAVLHNRLFPYLYTVTAEARDRGLPVMRHLLLEYPDDPQAWNVHDQYLLGDRLLVAPVLEEDAVERTLYLPAGRWWHWWSGEPFTGPGEVTVPAPIGEIPLFVKDGTLLPLFDGPIDTLAVEDDPELRGWTDLNESMTLRYYGNGSDQLTLWDGTRIDYRRDYGAAGDLSIDDGPSRSYRVVDPRAGYGRRVSLRVIGTGVALTAGIEGEPSAERPLEDGAIDFVGLRQSREHRFVLQAVPVSDQ